VLKNVLFLSSANGARSQMAEGLLRTLAGDAYEAYSAGSLPGSVDPLAVAVMAECGIDIGGQQAKGLQEFIGSMQFDHVITVCDRDEKACPVFPGKGTRAYWPVSDLAKAEGTPEERLEKFREARDYLEERVRRWLRERGHKQVLELSGAGTRAD
jgi:arsenate reductase (thioredoxin)